mmetsp:Transcript_3147/g.7171  ORF Transcript_3147/g.7171 Transcript_3147/m.7171 type:complete len:1319 (-) Transcript_3147:69-4025(-)
MGSSSKKRTSSSDDRDEEEQKERRTRRSTSSKREKSRSKSRDKEEEKVSGDATDGHHHHHHDDSRDLRRRKSSGSRTSKSPSAVRRLESTTPKTRQTRRSKSQGAISHGGNNYHDSSRTTTTTTTSKNRRTGGHNDEEEVRPQSSPSLKKRTTGTRTRSSSKSPDNDHNFNSSQTSYGSTILNDDDDDKNNNKSGSASGSRSTKRSTSSSNRNKSGNRSRSGTRLHRRKSHKGDNDAPDSPDSTATGASSSSKSRRRRGSSKDAERLNAALASNAKRLDLDDSNQDVDKHGRNSSGGMGILNSYLDSGSSSAGQLSTIGGDSQSVVSSASRRHQRRRRQSNPNVSSSASVFSGGGQTLSREVLREQRRARSSSAGHMSGVERRRSDKSSDRRRRDQKKKEEKDDDDDDDQTPVSPRVRRSMSDSSKDKETILLRMAKKMKDSDTTPTKSGRRSRASSSSKYSSSPRDTLGSPPSSPKRRPRSGSESQPETETDQTASTTATPGTVSTLADRQGRRRSMTSSYGAEIPPGFPIAAVDRNLSSKSSASDTNNTSESKTGRGEALHQSTPVLESTTQLRGRRASHISGNDSGNHMSLRGRGVTRVGAGAKGTADVREIRDLVAQEIKAMEHHKKLLRKRSESPKVVTPAPTSTSTTATAATTTDSSTSTMQTPSSPSPARQGPSRRSSSSGPILAPNRRRRQEEIDADAALPDTDSVSTPSQIKKKSWWNLSPKKSAQRSRSTDQRTQEATKSPTSKSPAGEKVEAEPPANLPQIDLSSTFDETSVTQSSVTASPKKGKRGSFMAASMSHAKKTAASIKSKFGRKKSKEDDSRLMQSLNCSMASLDPDALLQSSAEGNPGTSLLDMLIEGKEDAPESPSKTQSDAIDSSTPWVVNDKYTIETPDKRVSWIELPLHDPKQLLVKTSDEDGTNETSTTQELDQSISDHTDSDKAEEKESSTPSKTETPPRSPRSPRTPRRHVRSNPSLEEALRNNPGRRRSRAHDERTVGTTATSNTATTNTSQSTIKTTNRDPIFDGKRRRASTRTSSEKSSNNEPSSSESNLADARAQLQESYGSLGSRSSRSSQRSKGKSDKGTDDERKSIVHPTEEQLKLMNHDYSSDRQAVRRVSSLVSPDYRSKRKSYLPQRGSKVEKTESKDLKSSVISSLDTFLHHDEKKRPKVSSGNRSVQSAYERGAGERARQAREEKKKKAAEAAALARKERFAQISSPAPADKQRSNDIRRSRSMEDEEVSDVVNNISSINSNKNDDDDDDQSTSSAPMLHRMSTLKSALRTPDPVDRHRHVVDLKQTKFSNKLSKLHVAF